MASRCEGVGRGFRPTEATRDLPTKSGRSQSASAPRCEAPPLPPAHRIASRAIDPESLVVARIQQAVVKACHDLDAVKTRLRYTLANEPSEFASDYWTKVDPSWKIGPFRVREGQRPSEALLDILKHPEKYAFECCAGIAVAYTLAVMYLCGKSAFDHLYETLTVGPFVFDEKIRQYVSLLNGNDVQEADPKETPTVGDQRFYRNWDVAPELVADGRQGQNVVILPGGKVWGHPYGIVTPAQLIEDLDTYRVPNATRHASLVTLYSRMLPGVVLDWRGAAVVPGVTEEGMQKVMARDPDFVK